MEPSPSLAAPQVHTFRRTLFILWFALLMGPLLFFGVAAFVNLQAGESTGSGTGSGFMGNEAPEVVPLVIGAISILLTGVSFLLPHLLPARPKPRESGDVAQAAGDRMRQLQTRMIITWAVAEGGAMLAGVGMLLVGFAPVLVAAALLFPLAMLVQIPTESRIRSFLIDGLQDQGVSLEEAERHLAAL